MQKVAKRTLKIVIAIVTVLATVAGFAWTKWAGGCVGVSTSATEKFDSAIWSSGEIAARTRMLGSLLSGDVLHGKTAAEIMVLLGQPESSSSDQVGYIVSTYSTENACGLYRHAILKIYLDKNGITTKTSIAQD
jgi:hypothetical protein